MGYFSRLVVRISYEALRYVYSNFEEYGRGIFSILGYINVIWES